MPNDEDVTWMLVPRRLVNQIEELVVDNPPKDAPFVNKRGSGASRRKSMDKPLTLTEREMDVAYLIGQGQTNAEICAETGLRYDTVKDHVTQIRLKLRLEDRVHVQIHFAELMSRVKKPSRDV